MSPEVTARPQAPGTLEDDTQFVLTLEGMPLLKSSPIHSIVLALGRGRVLVPPGHLHWKAGLRWFYLQGVHCSIVTSKVDLECALILVLPSSFSSTSSILILCFLTGKHNYLCIHGWWTLFLCLRRQLGERERHGPVRRKGLSPWANHFPEPHPLLSPLSTRGHLCDGT